MQFIDTHSHMYLPQFTEDIDQAVQRAQQNGLEKIILPNIDDKTIKENDALSDAYPDLFIPLMGLHPTHVKEDYTTLLETIFKHCETNSYKGIGEIGIDLYWDKTYYEQQREAFITQVKFSVEKKMPFVIHARDSFNEIFEALKTINQAKFNGVFHAFTGTKEQADIVTEMGFYIGIGGIVTFKNSNLGEEIKHVDLEKIVLESDSPYLAPVPHRGKRNESSYIPLIAEKIADIKGISLNEVAETTTRNAKKLFNI